MSRYLLMTAAVALFGWNASHESCALAPDEVHEGKVVAVTGDSISVLDMEDNDVDKFVVTSSTTITRNGKPAKLSDILAGDRAKVTAVQEETKLVAKKISAMAPE